MTLVTTAGAVGVYFDKHKDKMYAAAFFSFFLGNLIGPILTEYLIKKTSYQQAMLIEASFFLLYLPAACVFRESNFCVSREDDSSDVQSEKGEVVTEEEMCRRQSVFSTSVDNIIIDEKVTESVSRSSSCLNILKSHSRVLKDKVFILYLVYFMFVSFGENTYYALAVEYAVETRNILDLEQAALGMTLTGVTSVIGSLAVAILSHWTFDRALFSSVTTLIVGMSLVFMPVVQSLGGMYAISVVYGFSDGLFAGGLSSTLAYQFGQNELFLTRYSYMLCVVGIGSVFGPIAAGYLGKAVGMVYSFYFLGGAVIAASVVLLLYWAGAKIMDSRESSDYLCVLSCLFSRRLHCFCD